MNVRPKIVVVEDMLTLRMLIVGLLKSLLKRENPIIIEASDGSEGFAIVQRECPDLVISDVEMPRLNGFELCRLLKGDPRLGHIPVVLITSKSNPEFRAQGLATGASALLLKPIRREEMNEVLASVLPQPR